jgi:FlaA1/EpsC-like NDP-sugar epimerase
MWRSHSLGEDLLFWGPVSRLVRRYLNWFMIDTLLTFFAIGLTGFLWRLAGPLDIGLLNALLIALGFAFLFSLTSATLGLNRIAWRHAYASDALGLGVSAILAMTVALLVNHYVDVVPPGMIVTAATLALLGFVGVRYRSRLLAGLGFRWLERPSGALAARERVLIVGSGLTGQFVAWLLADDASSSATRVIGYVDDDLYKQGIRYRGVSVVGRRADIPHLVTQHDVGIILFAIHKISGAERERVLAICHSTPARVVVMPDIIGDLNSLVSEKANGADAPTHPEPRTEASPLFASERIPPVQVQLWLADLEKMSEAGDLVAVRDRIRSIRKAAQDWRA